MKINKLKSVFFLPLQSGKKVTSDPSPFVQFTVGHKSYESKVRTPTCSTFTPTNIKLFLFYQKAFPRTPLCRVFFQTKYKTNEPLWEEAFTFLIHNPKCQELEVEVRLSIRVINK